MYAFSSRMKGLESSAVRDTLTLTQGQDLISFAGGLPAEEHFPIEAIKQAAERVFLQGPQMLQYGITEGSLALRHIISNWMTTHRNIRAEIDEIIVTSGSQQTIDLLAKTMIDPGDVVLVENPTYLACLQVLRLYGANIISVKSDENGMIPSDIEAKLRAHKPKFVYVVPTFSNPTGRVWTLERRMALLELCRQYQTLIFEDDPYSDLRYSGEAVPSIAALEGTVKDRTVVYSSTFSKIIAPGLRTGWAAADKRVIRMMARGKQSADLHSSVLDQHILTELMKLDSFSIDEHIRKITQAYKERMETMVSFLQHDQVWKDAVWKLPQGGMFIWVRLPDGLEPQALLKCALSKGVAFVPGEAFYVSNKKENTIRLNFSFAEPAIIHRGMERLSEAMSEFLGRYSV
ncbi:aminotransferase-like domain-containing protein [Paenibacillus marinisediminis]